MKTIADLAEEFAKEIIECAERLEYNENGPDAYVCNFCGNDIYYLGSNKTPKGHSKDCIVNKAKKLYYENIIMD